ncbi:MAG: hypothetical protein HY466_07210 [Deltaproteobacteria bacterium]|nr:hypothetical protein [Deltaproteobacteria bacterium]
MEKLFAPLKDLVGAVYGLLYDAATKVWNLAKPVIMIGLLIDLVTAKLGWITHILEYYRRTLEYTGGTHWLVLIIGGLVALAFFSKK